MLSETAMLCSLDTTQQIFDGLPMPDNMLEFFAFLNPNNITLPNCMLCCSICDFASYVANY